MRRAYTIDLLRGLAIIGMVLSGQMLWNAGLPAWMFHAQLPPPTFVFDPSVPGISWVDLVFPFFLFSMGAAFPLALRRKLDEGTSGLAVGSGVAVRWAMLVLFAVALGNLRGGALGDLPAWSKAVMQLAVWGLFCLMFVRVPGFSSSRNSYMHLAGAAGIVLLMLVCRYGLGLETTVDRSDIIILVLANMALFGSAVWWFTRDSLTARLGVLAVVVAMKIGAGVEGSWNETLWNASPAPWLFRFEFLKYLCIIIPGTIAGDLLVRWMRESPTGEQAKPTQSVLWGSALAFSLVLLNLYGLFSRQLAVNLVATLVLGFAAWRLLRREPFWGAVFGWGFFWLVLGLILEAYEGGIKKDHATLSYFFVTSGLASMVVVAAQNAMSRWNVRFSWLVKCGQNPMVAYTAAGFVILPVLTLLHLDTVLNEFGGLMPWCGFFRGVLVTAAVMGLTILFTNKKIFWRT